jgi:uncharacterized protein (DUF58 family)
VREYIPGDDIRTIDWNVTARSQIPYVKKYVEERELTVVFLVDSSASTKFGTRDKLKSEAIAEICGIMAFSAWRNNDKVGLISFTDRIEKYVPPRKGRSRILRVIRDILYPQIEGKGTDIKAALDFANQVLTRRAIIFLVSDFVSPDYEKPLKLLGRKHDLIAIKVRDPLEKRFPNAGYVCLEDAETGKTVYLNTASRRWRQEYQSLSAEKNDRVNRLLRSAKIDRIDIELGKDTVEPIFKFFKEREKRFRY